MKALSTSAAACTAPSRLGAALAMATVSALTTSAATPAQAQGVLNLVTQQAAVQWGGSGLGQRQDIDPWLASGSGGTPGVGVAAESDLAAGTLRAVSADANNTGGVLAYAYGRFELLLQNISGVALRFAAGDVSATVHASFARGTAGDAFGSSINQMTASLIGEGGLMSGAAGFSIGVAEDNRPGSPRVDFNPRATAGFSAAGSGDASGVVVDLGLPAFTIAPRGTLRLALNLTTAAHGYSPADLWSATTDAWNTAELSLRLPAGTTLTSPRPLAWVSVVPEPATALLSLLGLGLVTACARARRAA
jgi:hypothetical protein